MNKTDLLALADRLGTISPSEKSPEGLLADNLCLDISSTILRKFATLEPVSWLSIDCIGERYLCFTKPNDLDPVEPLFSLTGIINHE